MFSQYVNVVIWYFLAYIEYNLTAYFVFNVFRDAFDKEMEGLPSTTHSVGEFPPEL